MASRRRFRRIPNELRSKVIRLAARGVSMRQIGERTKVGLTSVRRIVNPFGGVFPAELGAEIVGRLTLDHRITIQVRLEQGETQAAIARQVGCHR